MLLFDDPQYLSTLIETAIATRSTRLGRTIHAKTLKHLSPAIPSFLLNHLVNFYSKLDHPTSAATVLHTTPYPSVVTWTALISGAVQNSDHITALHHFVRMIRSGVRPNDFTFPCVFKAAGAINSAQIGKSIHGFSTKTGISGDVYVGCGVLDMYFKSRCKEDGRRMFDEMPVRNIVAWNAVMTNGVIDGCAEEVAGAFVAMRRVGELPNSISICAALNVAAAAGAIVGSADSVRGGEQVHGFVVRFGLSYDVRVGNGLIDFYGKSRMVKSARRVFNSMVTKNDVSWCSLIVSYAGGEDAEDAFHMFLEARRHGFNPSDFMVSTILTTCCGLTGLDLGRSVHAVSVRCCIDRNIFVGSSLIDMYGKCGSIVDAEHVFDELPVKNSITWNAILGGYAQQGQAKLALDTLDLMTTTTAVNPNYVTVLNVMTACSRAAGFVEKGVELFWNMKKRFGVEPQLENYACLVDMVGRAGMVERALEFIKGMPMRPSVSVWGALLGACKMYGKVELGRIAAEKLFELDPFDSGNRVLLANLYASTNRWEESTSVRKAMERVGMRKDPGCSWITWKNTIHIFRAKDTKHPRNPEIRAMLAKLRTQMESSGYSANTKFTLFDLQEEEKETELFYHSEKLALAFGLIWIPTSVPIRITKNLRVCGDCHNAFKLVSGIYQREILVRDNNRFHNFKNYQCSCSDYW